MAKIKAKEHQIRLEKQLREAEEQRVLLRLEREREAKLGGGKGRGIDLRPAWMKAQQGEGKG